MLSHCLRALIQHPSRRRSATHRRHCNRFRPRLESLENRALLSTVTTLQDGTGIGSLRDAIAAGGTVTFAAGLKGTITLNPKLGPLTITQDVTIDGPGAGTLRVSGGDQIQDFSIMDGTDVRISGLTITGGKSSDSGGAIAVIPADVNLRLTGCVLTGNTAAFGGGAILMEGIGTLSLTSCTVTDNVAQGVPSGGGGGGILTEHSDITLTDCTVSDNTDGTAGSSTSGGGGIQTVGGTVTLLHSSVSHNSTVGAEDGGGIDSEGGKVSLTDSSMIGNRAIGGFEGGGAINSEGGAVTLVASTLADNTTGGNENGGAIESEGGMVTLTNSTVTGNSATGGGARTEGGGAVGSEGGTITLINSTVFANSAAGLEGGGGLDAEGGRIFLTNSIVAGDTATGGPGPDIAGLVTLADHCLIGDGADTGLPEHPSGDLVGSTGHVIDPKLGPLQNNGGPTPTLALLPGSPCINAGDDSVLLPPLGLTRDQRGAPRKVGSHVDIGAFEFHPLFVGPSPVQPAAPVPIGRRRG